MKVLYTGVYRDSTGWGRATIDYIMALYTAGVDIVIRPIKLNNHRPELPEVFKELENKSTRGANIVIQHILPHLMDYDGYFQKCIGLYVTETTHFQYSNWASNINLMDEAWVSNRQSKQASEDSGVTVPIRIVPHAINVKKFHTHHSPLPIRDKIGDDFIFYFIGEMTRRKNLAALIKAFHLEFDPTEPVQLLIKTNKTQKELQQFCHTIKAGLKLYKDIDFYKPEIIITQHLSDEDIDRLHYTCDCFVMPSYGEAWNYPACDAMGFGKTPIVTAFGGFKDYISDDEGWLVPYTLDNVFGVLDTFGDLFVANEQWANIHVHALCKAMREAYDNKKLREKKAKAGRLQITDFSYEKVGGLMKEILNETQEVH